MDIRVVDYNTLNTLDIIENYIYYSLYRNNRFERRKSPINYIAIVTRKEC